MKRERFEKMNVVPFIDIVLVLLVIILATSTFINNSSIKVDLPTATSTKNEDTKHIKFSVKKDGTYYYKAQPISLNQITATLNTLNPKNDSISLNIDKHSSFKYFVELIDLIKSKNFDNINIITTN